jgi:carboxylesterase
MPAVQAQRAVDRDPVTGVIRGAEAFAFGDGRDAVLFLHGWSSTPRELRFLAGKIAPLGLRCEGPLLKGHGTRLEDLAPTRFGEYLAESEAAYAALAARHARVFVCGLSMGGLLALHLAISRPVAGLILVAPFLLPSGRTFGIPNRWLVGRVPLPAVMAKGKAGPILDPEGLAGHITYPAMPSASMVSVVIAARRMLVSLPRVQSPTLIFHARNDRTSDFRGSLVMVEKLGTEDKTLVAFNRGNHVLTLDYPRPRLEAESCAWLSARASS